MPESKFKFIWDIFFLIVLIINLWFVPLNISFNTEIHKSNWVKIIFELLPFLIIFLNIPIVLNSAYFHKGALYEQKLDILKHYLKSDLIEDLLSIIPFYLTYHKRFVFFELLYLIRIKKIQRIIKKLEDEIIISDKNQYKLKFFKLFFFVIYSAHIFGCFWHRLGKFILEYRIETSWLEKENLVDKDWLVRYINCVYFTILTMITVGIANMGDFVEKIFSIFIFLFVSGIFGYTISTIQIILNDMNKVEYDLKFFFFN